MTVQDIGAYHLAMFDHICAEYWWMARWESWAYHTLGNRYAAGVAT